MTYIEAFYLGLGLPLNILFIKSPRTVASVVDVLAKQSLKCEASHVYVVGEPTCFVPRLKLILI